MSSIRPVMIALALCLAGCGARMENDGAGEEIAAAAAAPQPAAANASAETPIGPCPFATRGWQATISPPMQAGEKASVGLNGEARPDKNGRMPMIWSIGERKPPTLVLELISDSEVEPQADRGWMTLGTVFEDYDPKFTHAIVLCAGAEIARVPVLPMP